MGNSRLKSHLFFISLFVFNLMFIETKEAK